MKPKKVNAIPIKKEVEVKKPSKEITSLLNSLNKKFGDNAVQLGFNSELEKADEIKRLSTGNLALDIALGGGIPKGKFTHISGAFSTTKSTLCLHLIREAQNKGLVCALVDAEGTIDEAYLRLIGVDVDSLLYSRPDGLEEATQSIIEYQKSGLVHLALFDSLEASPSTKEFDSSMEDTIQMGVKPKLLGEFFRKYQAHNNRLVREGKDPFTLVCLNQLRERIGGYGDPEYYSGGRAIGFTASVDIRLRRGDWISEGTGNNKEIVGQVVKFKIEKNKTYKRMQVGECDFYFSDDNSAGIKEAFYDNFKAVIIEAVSWGIVEKGGAWFKVPSKYVKDSEEELKFQGLDKLVDYLRDNEYMVELFKKEILNLAKKK